MNLMSLPQAFSAHSQHTSTCTIRHSACQGWQEACQGSSLASSSMDSFTSSTIVTMSMRKMFTRIEALQAQQHCFGWVPCGGPPRQRIPGGDG